MEINRHYSISNLSMKLLTDFFFPSFICKLHLFNLSWKLSFNNFIGLSSTKISWILVFVLKTLGIILEKSVALVSQVLLNAFSETVNQFQCK